MTTWIRIAAVLAVGCIISTLLRFTLPSDRGPTLLYGGVFHLLPLNRVAFWLCMAVAILVAIVLAFRTACRP